MNATLPPSPQQVRPSWGASHPSRRAPAPMCCSAPPAATARTGRARPPQPRLPWRAGAPVSGSPRRPRGSRPTRARQDWVAAASQSPAATQQPNCCCLPAPPLPQRAGWASATGRGPGRQHNSWCLGAAAPVSLGRPAAPAAGLRPRLKRPPPPRDRLPMARPWTSDPPATSARPGPPFTLATPARPQRIHSARDRKGGMPFRVGPGLKSHLGRVGGAWEGVVGDSDMSRSRINVAGLAARPAHRPGVRVGV
jgi:hypothetical protein